uniref:Uncharacterized protein n=1 Tax=Salvator merianae TaxID=96440 RepID=A0A8D0BP05_SALMN
MADQNPVQNLCDEATCPICLEYFRDPVMIDCGHNFCQICISQHFGKSEAEASCPQCREIVRPRKMKPNRPLASIVEITKKFSVQTIRGAAEAVGKLCNKHQEPLKLFCEDDVALLCLVCDKSKEHREHKVIPKEEALEKYKDEVSERLKVLRKEREAIVSLKLKEETENQELLAQAETERQKIVAEFKQMHKLLEEQERILLAQLKELEDNIKDIGKKHIAELSKEIESIEGFIKKMENKQEQPANDFLQDVGATLKRCIAGKCETPLAYPSELTEQIKTFSNAITNKFKAYRSEDLEVPTLYLFRNGNYIHSSQLNRYGHVACSDELCAWSYVMGTERFTSGCHSWVMNMRNEPLWAFGVARDHSQDRNETRVWAFGKKSRDGYIAFTSKNVSLGPPFNQWQQVRVFRMPELL